MAPTQRVLVGRVAGAHGIRGEIRVRHTGEGPGSLLAADRVHLAWDGEAGGGRDYEVQEARPGRSGEVRLALAGVRDRETAEALAGQAVWMDAARIPPPGPGEYYGFQLVGCRVEGHDGRAVGTVREIWETGGHDVLVVEDPDGREVLLPAAQDLLREVDVEAGRIVIELVPGLLDAAE